MIDTSKLKGLMAEKGYTQRKMAGEIGISEATMYKKMHEGIFGSDEMTAISMILEMTDTQKLNIFFAN